MRSTPKFLACFAILLSLLVIPGSGQAETTLVPLSSLHQDWSYLGYEEGGELGYAVAPAGDVNGDGYDDVIIGGPVLSGLGPEGLDREGVVFVFHGSRYGLQADPAWVRGGGQRGARFGHSVTGVGDVNQDGWDDIVVGAPNYQVSFGDSGSPPSGAVFLFLGSAEGLQSEPAWTYLAEAREIALGRAVAPAGDFNQDGFADVLVAAPLYGPEQASAGKVYLFYGEDAGLGADPAWTFECDQPGAGCGAAISSASRVGRDAQPGFAIGAPRYDGVASDTGRVFVFSAAGINGQPELLWVGDGDQSGMLFGGAVAFTGDFNADGFSDLVIGAPRSDSSLSGAGTVLIHLGSDRGLSDQANYQLYGSQAGAGFGGSLDTGGDVNGDGFDDLVIGASLYGETGGYEHPDEGALYLYMGARTGLLLQAAWSTYGDKAEALFGFSVALAGDVNGDQYADLLAGAPDYRIDESVIAGQARLYQGSAISLLNYVFFPAVVLQGP